ncbi:hypothetical protein CcI156_15315 [Frankia sp. CcI156]|uniref:DUF3501 domain-containing protein n=1 Tax=Frankia casuarinae (strain DSM 45818 / CECT 9043 / HFP020203 / CcI3) TaxID=106370 RepID=Q2J8C5_FRACC|nr:MULTISPECIES: DUF3501 family protein [Frankia]ABD12467.1 hypothetical protein Francci3_3110 [Frankia casuarinae]ETA01448.1 hypothetical protein CcI6DRAFT_03062 [Frankia sp. CcI6]EYT91954.1 hypothetical protein ThrDRAFT_02335 [Frankia casuarinae]KDA44711.1 hypothetical protein BMG523Draft_00231 [Frankia sp. BMG5.23]KEZ36393.1 Protein of unknown function (DUF3501) [Frankia sp. CeD]
MALTIADITTDHQAYAERRLRLRSQMILVRAERRVRVGDIVVLEFENEQTLRYQVQEMVYTERLTASADVAHEIDAYSRLLPSSHVLTATVFIELSVLETVREELGRLAGLQHSLALEIGGIRVAGEEIPGLDEDPDMPTETVSVHMVRFALTDSLRDAFRDPGVPVELVVEHPEYSEATPLTGATRRVLIADLALRS